MLPLNHTDQQSLDPSQPCPFCSAAMWYVEGDYYQRHVHFHYCRDCEHHVFHDEEPLPCHCAHCLQSRKQAIAQTRKTEKLHVQQQQAKSQGARVLSELSLLDRVFLLALFEQQVSGGYARQETLCWTDYRPERIAPSYQLFQHLKKHALQQGFLLVIHELEPDLVYPNLRLIDYPDPALLTLTFQLRQWLIQHQGVAYLTTDDVRVTLLTILAHEVLHLTQHRCQQIGVQFYADQKWMSLIQQLLGQLAVTQIMYWIDRALNYLQAQGALQRSNQGFINTHLLRKTLIQYRERSQRERWEIPNLPRPAEMPYSAMTRILLFDYLQLNERAIVQPLWKCWQDIAPQLQFFEHQQCIHCGSTDLDTQYKTLTGVSMVCKRCRQQNHYFIGGNPVLTLPHVDLEDVITADAQSRSGSDDAG